ncbi:hypothetical protein JCM19237_261 [Photobacterium aphoticum]|uniref:Uncharacterized protein n=1 Tax=Photobacterium aphoticum TaxID=754436 RepID=A0A090QYD3_9GAMM|nr:hypothetical protein JCM19237_261 [Photobacterium aphoticum]
MKNIREVRRILEFPARTKVRWQPLNDMAAMYGVKIEYESHRGLIRLLTLEGKSFREDELVTRNKAGEPVMKINDLTWHEWTELLAECADMIAEMR